MLFNLQDVKWPAEVNVNFSLSYSNTAFFDSDSFLAARNLYVFDRINILCAKIFGIVARGDCG